MMVYSYMFMLSFLGIYKIIILSQLTLYNDTHACKYNYTKENDVKVLQVVFAESEQPSPVAQQCVLVASKTTHIIHNKYVPSLNVTELWKSLLVQKLQPLT